VWLSLSVELLAELFLPVAPEGPVIIRERCAGPIGATGSGRARLSPAPRPPATGPSNALAVLRVLGQIG